MNLRTTIKAMNLRTTLKTGVVALACGAILLLGMSSFAQQWEQVDFLTFYIKAPTNAPMPPPEEPTEPESFSGLGSASLDVKVNRTFCGDAPAPPLPASFPCILTGGTAVAAAAGNNNLVLLGIQLVDQGGSPIDGVAGGRIELSASQFFPPGGPPLERVLPPDCIFPVPPAAGGTDRCFVGIGNGMYGIFVRPQGGLPWRTGSYFVEVNVGTARELVQIDIP